MIDFVKMENKDCEEVALLEGDIFGRDAWTAEDFRESLCCDYAVYVVARDTENSKIVACAGVRNLCGDGDITNVLVHPDYRHHGIAEGLLNFLMSEGETIGIRNYTLEARESNEPAIKLYEKLGFVSEGKRPGFYDYPKEDAVIFWKREKKDV